MTVFREFRECRDFREVREFRVHYNARARADSGFRTKVVKCRFRLLYKGLRGPDLERLACFG